MMNKINFILKKRLKPIIYTILTIVTLAVYWQVNHFDFINLDDVVYVANNSYITSGLTPDGIRWAFSTRYFDLWHPLVWLSFMFDYQLYGLKAGGYHLTNLILHVLSTLLIFWLFCRMTGAVWRSAFVAAFFALHPLHVESVAWIAERKDVLSAFFWILTLCFYVRYTEKPDSKRYLLVLFSYILAVMSKAMVVTLPLILILLDYWPLNRFESKKDNLILWQIKEKTPLFVVSVILVIITLYNPSSTDASAKVFPLASRLANAPVSFFAYLIKTFWPYDMAVFYPFSEQIPLWQVIGSTLLIIIISGIIITKARQLPYLFTGWFWYAVTIAPVIGIIQIGFFSMANRYHYLPSIGIAIGLAWGIPYFMKSREMRKILLPAAVTVLIVFAVLTWKQCSYWRNSFTLLRHTLHVTKNNYLAHGNLASALLEKGKIREAVYHYNKAIGINPDYDVAYYNLGVVYYSAGQKQIALNYFKEAIRISPDYAAAYYNMGIVYLDLGLYKNAIEKYSDAIRISPGYAHAYNNRALVHITYENRELGCQDAQKACALGVCKASEWAKNNGLCH